MPRPKGSKNKSINKVEDVINETKVEDVVESTVEITEEIEEVKPLIITEISPVESILARVTNGTAKLSSDGKTIHCKVNGHPFDIGTACGVQRIEFHLKSHGLILG